MSNSWSDVATLVVNLLSHEPPFVQIMSVVGAAFSVVIFLDGLRVNFLPARRQTADQPQTHTVERFEFPAATVTAHDAREDVAGISLPVPQQAPAPKSRLAASLKSHQAPRPKIRRTRGSSF